MDLTGWTPSYAYFSRGQLLLDWCYTGTTRFTEPFFGDTIDRAQRDPGTLLFRHQTTLEEARQSNRFRPGMAPSGFIFHMSRCGSTLISQMLGALPENRVLSEPTPLNAVIRAALVDPELPREAVVDWLRTVVSALGCPLPGESRYFVKFDCWHVLALPLIVEAFPETPWIFLYREPAEVLVSQVRMPGAWTVSSALDPIVFGVRQENPWAIPRPEYVARGLACMCEAALDGRSLGRGLLANYAELPDFTCGTMLQHFGASLPAADVERMRSASRSDAKMPQMPFASDRDAKRQALTPALLEAVDRWLSPAYERLESLRTARPVQAHH
jgi:hypothetical protein